MRTVPFKDIRWSLDSEGAWLSLRVPDRQLAQEACAEIVEGRRYVAEIKEQRKKRSLDANAYCFVLIDKIAEKLGVDKLDVYREAVRSIGGNSEIVCVKQEAAAALRDGWSKNGIGWLTEEFPSKLEGCVNVRLYFGSSTYDSRIMSLLIDHVVQDAKALGIETMTPEELQRLEEDWHGKK